jgi:hypothetical protein
LPGHGAAAAVLGAMSRTIATITIRVMKHSMPSNGFYALVIARSARSGVQASRFSFLLAGLRHARPGTREQHRGRRATSAQ